MKKLKMHDYIIHMMAEWDDTSLLISCLKDGADYVEREAKVVICEELEVSLADVLQVIVDEPKVFKIGKHTHYMELVEPDKLAEYVKEASICEEAQNAIRNYVSKAKDPIYYATIDIGQTVELEKQIKADTKYIDWVCKMIEKYNRISNTDIHLAKNGEEVLYLLMLYNLFNLTMKYCKKNMVYYGAKGASESYVITYGKEEDTTYIRVTEFSNGDVKTYEAKKWYLVRQAAYFPDVALGVPIKEIKQKEKMLAQFEEQFFQANRLGIPYDRIKAILKSVYEYYDN